MIGSLASLVPTPLHPALVHLPMALAVLVPLFAVGAVVAIRRGALPMRTWSLALAMFFALAVSGVVSQETGESQEERVESAVPRVAFQAHNAAADRFVVLSAVLVLIAGVGLLPARSGAVARLVATAGSLAVLAAGYQVGHTGGALVYRYGAAGAYTNDAVGSGSRERASFEASARRLDGAGVIGDDDDDDDDESGARTTLRSLPLTGAAAIAPFPSHRAVPLTDSTRP
jgi:uncharacterized membrane protein